MIPSLSVCVRVFLNVQPSSWLTYCPIVQALQEVREMGQKEGWVVGGRGMKEETETGRDRRERGK